MKTPAPVFLLPLFAALVSCAPAAAPQVSVTSPPYGSEISGPTPIVVHAPGYASVVVKCWKQGPGPGADSTVGTIALDAHGDGSLNFPADQYPHGPITVRLSASQWLTGDNCYLQLYNQGGIVWHQGIPHHAPPEADGMALAFADDFNAPLSISGQNSHATYYANKPDGGNFSAIPFTGPEDAHSPFAQIDSYLRIRADQKANTTGLISSLKPDDSGVKVALPCYFECRFLGPSAPGTWPAFWIMTDYMTDRLKGRDDPVDELDIIEAYGGEGPHQPTHSSDTSDAVYRITSHFWNQGAAGDAQPGVANPVHMRSFGGKSAWWETFHTYGCKITAEDTIYYCDDVEVGRHPTGSISREYPFFFLIDLGVGGNGWPVDLSRYGGLADLYVDYVRVYSGAPRPTSSP